MPKCNRNLQYIILKTLKIRTISEVGMSDPHLMFIVCVKGHGEGLLARIASSVVSFAVSSPSGVAPLLLLRWAVPTQANPNLREHPELARGRLEPPGVTPTRPRCAPRPARRSEYEYLLLVF